MKLLWHGHSCFAVETGGYTVVFDPYADGSVPGYAPLQLAADAVYCSHDHRDHNAREAVTLSGRTCPVCVETIGCFHDEKRGRLRGRNTIHILSAEGMRIVHLGDLGERLKGAELEALRGADVLLVPVGGTFTINAAAAKALIDDIAPRIVVPMHYRWDGHGYDSLSELDAFTSLCGNVIEYSGNALELNADTPAQTAVLHYMPMRKYYGIDVGGTTVKLGLFTEEGLLQKWEIPTDITEGGRNILRDIVNALPGEAAAACIGVPGAVLPDGTVNRCVNLGWGVCRPADEFTALTGIPCRMCNDANAAAVGEQWRGGGEGFASILLVALGTGIGAGVVYENKLLAGAHGAAGEVGHICVNPEEKDACGCGHRGCLEQYASATGISRLAFKAGLGELSAKDVFDRAKEGNETALKVVDTACDYLGRGIAAACAVFDPEAVVIGGGVSLAGEFLRLRVETAFQKYAFHACSETELRLAALGGEAGMYGNARLAMLLSQSPGE